MLHFSSAVLAHVLLFLQFLGGGKTKLTSQGVQPVNGFFDSVNQYSFQRRINRDVAHFRNEIISTQNKFSGRISHGHPGFVRTSRVKFFGQALETLEKQECQCGKLLTDKPRADRLFPNGDGSKSENLQGAPKHVPSKVGLLRKAHKQLQRRCPRRKTTGTAPSRALLGEPRLWRALPRALLGFSILDPSPLSTQRQSSVSVRPSLSSTPANSVSSSPFTYRCVSHICLTHHPVDAFFV